MSEAVCYQGVAYLAGQVPTDTTKDIVGQTQDVLSEIDNVLAEFGPNLGRPTVDTLKGTSHANMKEMRFNWMGDVWRVAFAFDPQRQAVLLVGGDKSGAAQKRFYKRLISVADNRYSQHLATLNDAIAKEPKNGKKTR